ncbi:Trafficking protein particle complex subunit 1 [Melipona quadrifasciata]|uniref:Trafficking protein particle complex subunit n=1 Tax=Melipona quadrifasciata TaxID=166423 RepID=A0A0M9A957_9HYME|nr:Trafficking protein particle complex subunit 1 [Melipona quadrifasciata]
MLNRVKLRRSLAGPAKVRINEINREALIIEGTPLNKLGITRSYGKAFLGLGRLYLSLDSTLAVKKQMAHSTTQSPIEKATLYVLSSEAKLMYGMLFSIKSFVSKISPLDPKEGFLYYKTSKYTLHYLETPSGLKFVLNTDNVTQNARELLQQLYREVYLEYVVKNPLCQLNEPIQSELFKLKVDELFKKSPLFLSRSI